MPEPRRTRATDGIELRLQHAWASYFPGCVSDVSLDYFESGGDSVQALRMLDAIEDEFNVDISVEELVSNASVSAMAALLRTEERAVSSKLVIELQAGRPDQPIVVCVHPLPGTVVRYVPLARRLAGRAEVWGIQSSGLDPGAPIDVTIQQMAARYLPDLMGRLSGPTRPVTIVGYSLGALVGWELSKLWSEASPGSGGFDLVAIDAEPDDRDGRSSLQEAIHNLVRRSLDLDLDVDQLETLSRDDRIGLIVEEGLATGKLTTDLGASRLRRLLEVVEVNSLAATDYRAGPADLRMGVVRRAALGATHWSQIANVDAVVHLNDVDHNSIMDEPAVADVADFIAGRWSRS